MKNIKTFEQFDKNDIVEERFLGIGKTNYQRMEKDYEDKKDLKEIVITYFTQALKLGAIKNKLNKSNEEVLTNIIESALNDPDAIKRGDFGTLRIINNTLTYIPISDADKMLKGKGGAITGSGLT